MFRSAVMAVLAIALSSSAASAQTSGDYLTFSYEIPQHPQPQDYLTFTYDVPEHPKPQDYLTFTYEAPEFTPQDFLTFTFEVPEFVAPSSENYLTFSYDLPHDPEAENYLVFTYDVPELTPASSEEGSLLTFTYEPPQFVEASSENHLNFSYEIPELSLATDRAVFDLWYDVVEMARERRLAFSLYAAQGALQVLDVVTTFKALGDGHHEGNPMFKSGNRSAMVIAKATALGLHLFAVERLEKRNPKAAMWVRVGTNALMAVVVANNLAVIRK